MAKVFLSIECLNSTDFSDEKAKKLELNNIPFESDNEKIYLISKSEVFVKSREYDKPYSRFCMQVADSTNSSIYMGEGSLKDEILEILVNVFGDPVEFNISLSTGSDSESGCISLNLNNGEYEWTSDIESDNDEEFEDEIDDFDKNDEILKRINAQIHPLKNLYNSEEIVKVLVHVNSGLNYKARVEDDGIELNGVMEYNRGSLYYEIPAKKLYQLLSSKPFDQINSSDLLGIDYELHESKDGYLTINNINNFTLDDEDELVDLLKGSSYEIDEFSESSQYDLLYEKINDLFFHGEILDSSYEFNSLISLEFNDDQFGSYFIDLDYEDSLLKRAKKLKEKEEYKSAVLLFIEYLQINFSEQLIETTKNNLENESLKDLIDVLTLISNCYEELEEFDNAAIYFSKLIIIEPNKDYNFAHLANCLNKTEKYSEAEGFFKEAINLNPNNIWAFMKYGDCLTKQNKNSEAILIFQDGIEKNPTQPKNTTSLFWLHQLKAHLLYEQENWLEALKDYEKAIEICKEDAKTNPDLNNSLGLAYRRSAQSYYNLDKYEQAINFYEKSQELDDSFQDTYTYYYLGESYRFIKKYQEAITSYKECVKLEEDQVHAFAYSSMAYCALEIKDFESSVEFSKDGVQDIWNISNGGKAYYNLGEFDAAINNYNKAIELDPNYKWAYQEKGKALFELKKYQEADECFSKVIELDFNYKWAYQERGKTKVELKKYSDAIDDFTKVIELDPNYKWAYKEKGDLLFFMDEFELSKDVYLKAFEIDEDYCLKSSISINLAIIHHLNENFEEADKIYKRCKQINIHKKNLVLYYNDVLCNKKLNSALISEDEVYEKGIKEVLVIALINRGKIEHYKPNNDFDELYSINDLSKAIEIDDNAYLAYFFRSKIYLNNYYSSYSLESGINDLKACLKIERYVPALIKLSSLSNDEESKIELITEAIKIDSKNSLAWQYYGDYLFKSEKYKEALESYIESNSIDSDGWILKRIADCYMKLMDSDKAIDFLSRAIIDINWKEEWHYQLAELYLNSNKIDLAEEAIYKAIKIEGYEKYFDVLAKILFAKYSPKKHPKLANDLNEYFTKVTLSKHYSNDNKISEYEYLSSYEKIITAEEETIFTIMKFFKEDTLNKIIENGNEITIKQLIDNPSINVPEEIINKFKKSNEMEINFYYYLNIKKVVNENKTLIHKDLGELEDCFRLYTFNNVFRKHTSFNKEEAKILVNNENWEVSYNLDDYDLPRISNSSIDNPELLNIICNEDEDGEDYEEVEETLIIIHQGNEYDINEFITPLNDLNFEELYNLQKSEVEGFLFKVEVLNGDDEIEYTKENIQNFNNIKL